MSKTTVDIAIVGGGPAGLTAAIYTGRSSMDTKIFEEKQPGGQLWWSEKIENYPGFPQGVESFELAEYLTEQAKKFGAEIVNEKVEEVKQSGKDFLITTGRQKINARGVIISTGASMKQLGVKGEKKFTGKGVSYCAVCDGPLYKDRVVAVVGGGNTACEEALYLTKFAGKVYLIHRRPRLRAVKGLREKVEKSDKIQTVLDDELEEISGTGMVENISLKSGKTLDVEGVFIFIGLLPNTEFLDDSFVNKEEGFIVTDSSFKTSLKGVYAAGDCRKDSLRQIVTACGEGAYAGEEARKYVEEKKGIDYDW
ncbi:MAG: thioredoxin-disulfide reductase [Elusimicrobiota bacterium]